MCTYLLVEFHRSTGSPKPSHRVPACDVYGRTGNHQQENHKPGDESRQRPTRQAYTRVNWRILWKITSSMIPWNRTSGMVIIRTGFERCSWWKSYMVKFQTMLIVHKSFWDMLVEPYLSFWSRVWGIEECIYNIVKSLLLQNDKHRTCASFHFTTYHWQCFVFFIIVVC